MEARWRWLFRVLRGVGSLSSVPPLAAPFRPDVPIGSAWERLCQEGMTVASDLRRAVEQLTARERPAGLPTSSGE